MTGVRLEDGTAIRANNVVVAAGMWARELGQRVELEGSQRRTMGEDAITSGASASAACCPVLATNQAAEHYVRVHLLAFFRAGTAMCNRAHPQLFPISRSRVSSFRPFVLSSFRRAAAALGSTW